MCTPKREINHRFEEGMRTTYQIFKDHNPIEAIRIVMPGENEIIGWVSRDLYINKILPHSRGENYLYDIHKRTFDFKVHQFEDLTDYGVHAEVERKKEGQILTYDEWKTPKAEAPKEAGKPNAIPGAIPKKGAIRVALNAGLSQTSKPVYGWIDVDTFLVLNCIQNLTTIEKYNRTRSERDFPPCLQNQMMCAGYYAMTPDEKAENRSLLLPDEQDRQLVAEILLLAALEEKADWVKGCNIQEFDLYNDRFMDECLAPKRRSCLFMGIPGQLIAVREDERETIG